MTHDAETRLSQQVTLLIHLQSYDIIGVEREQQCHV
jgi:hypothetical protein